MELAIIYNKHQKSFTTTQAWWW